MYNVTKPTTSSVRLEKQTNARIKFLRETKKVAYKTLEVLSRDISRSVRYHVAKHEATTIKILKRLSTDDDRHIQKVVALNPNTPESILEALSKSNYTLVQEAIVTNPNISDVLYRKLLLTKGLGLEEYLIAQERTPTEFLEKQEYKYTSHRKAIIKNPKFASLDIDFTLEITEVYFFLGKKTLNTKTLFSYMKGEDFAVFLKNFYNHISISQDPNKLDIERYTATMWIKKHIDFIQIARKFASQSINL